MIDRFVVVPASYVLFLREDGGRRAATYWRWA